MIKLFAATTWEDLKKKKLGEGYRLYDSLSNPEAGNVKFVAMYNDEETLLISIDHEEGASIIGSFPSMKVVQQVVDGMVKLITSYSEMEEETPKEEPEEEPEETPEEEPAKEPEKKEAPKEEEKPPKGEAPPKGIKKEAPEEEDKKESMLTSAPQKWGVRWQEFDRNDRIVTKEKEFNSRDARDKFVSTLEKKDNFYRISSWLDATEKNKEASVKQESADYYEYGPKMDKSLKDIEAVNKFLSDEFKEIQHSVVKKIARIGGGDLQDDVTKDFVYAVLVEELNRTIGMSPEIKQAHRKLKRSTWYNVMF